MNKKINVYLSSLFTMTLALFLLLSGCKKDDSVEVKTNSFSWNGKTYDTPEASVVKYMYINTFSGAFVVAINSSSLDFKIDSGIFAYSTANPASYDYIFFYLRPSLTATTLGSGTYIVNISSPTMACYGGSISINDNPNLSTSGTNLNVLTGSVVVTRTDSANYIFDYSFNLKDKSTLTGYYKGSVATGTYNYLPK